MFLIDQDWRCQIYTGCASAQVYVQRDYGDLETHVQILG